MSAVAGSRLRAEVDRSREMLVDVRRALHRHPELSHEESATAARAAKHCEQLGFTVRTEVGGDHGVIADLHNGEGPLLMLRADMDALPIRESGDARVVTSEVDGVMHACGHDGHVAMTLGAAAALTSLRDAWSGTLRCCFQPAEERAEGAMPMIDAGAADGVDRVLGIHLWAQLEVGRIAVAPGVLFGSADSFTVSVRGRGGHGGMPHTTIDPMVAAAQTVLALQTVVSRETSPFSPAVITVGKMAGGTAMNVIADTVEIEGTVRAVEQSERERLLRRVEEVAAAIAAAHRCAATYVHTAGCPPVVSNADVAELVRRAAVATVGEDRVQRAHPITVGDDVACFLDRAPGCYFLVGAGAPGKENPAHHSAGFDIDEGCLPVGAETLVRAALEILS